MPGFTRLPHARRSPATRWATTLAAGVVVLGSLAGVAGCQFQTLRDYTPATGTQTAIDGVTLRDMTLVLTSDGQAVLTGSLTSYRPDELVGVQGVALTTDGSDGAALAVTPPAEEVPTGRTAATQLLDYGIYVSSPDLRAGGLARLQFSFATAGTVELQLPVLTTDSPEYAGVSFPPTPSPVPSGSLAPSGAPSGEPSPTTTPS